MFPLVQKHNNCWRNTRVI